MKIVGMENLDPPQIESELQQGAKFVIYEYCISILIMTFKRPTDIHFIRAGHGSVGKGMPYTLLSLLLGWWGIPWGPIYTIGSLVTNLRGGKDVTREVLASMTSR